MGNITTETESSHPSPFFSGGWHTCQHTYEITQTHSLSHDGGSAHTYYIPQLNNFDLMHKATNSYSNHSCPIISTSIRMYTSAVQTRSSKRSCQSLARLFGSQITQLQPKGIIIIKKNFFFRNLAGATRGNIVVEGERKRIHYLLMNRRSRDSSTSRALRRMYIQPEPLAAPALSVLFSCFVSSSSMPGLCIHILVFFFLLLFFLFF